MAERQLLWDVTGVCNLMCSHCYAYDKYEWRENSKAGRRKDLTLDESKEMLRRTSEMGYDHVHLLGGEPLLRKDIKEIIEFARDDLDLRVTMNTNGMLLDRNGLIDFLIDAEVYQVSVSFEGVRARTHDRVRGKGSFEKAVTNLRALARRVRERDSDMLVGIGFVMTSHGLRDTRDLAQFALDVGANGMTVDMLSRDGNAWTAFDQLDYADSDALDELELLVSRAKHELPDDFALQINVKPQVRRYLSDRFGTEVRGEAFGDQCPAGDKTMLVECDGTTTPCGILNKEQKGGEAIAAQVYTPEPIDILKHDADSLGQTGFFRSFGDFKRSHQGTVPTCASCEYKAECQPCPVEYLEAEEIGQCVISNDRWGRWKEESFAEPVERLREIDAGLGNDSAVKVIDLAARGLSVNEISALMADDAGGVGSVREDVWHLLMELRSRGYFRFGFDEVAPQPRLLAVG